MNTWEVAGTVANILAALSAATAAVFTYFTVKTATETNKIAAEQSKANREYQEKSLRPSLDINRSSFKVDLKGDFLGDWKEDSDNYKPRYASNYIVFVENLGNIPARNIEYSIGIKNIKDIIKFIEDNINEIEERTGVKVTFDLVDSLREAYNIGFHREYNGSVETPTFKSVYYVEELGYLKSYSAAENSPGEIFVPKLFLIFINLLRDQIASDHLKPELEIKFKYFDPYSIGYIQSFVLRPLIRNFDIFNSYQYIGYFEIEETINEKLMSSSSTSHLEDTNI